MATRKSQKKESAPLAELESKRPVRRKRRSKIAYLFLAMLFTAGLLLVMLPTLLARKSVLVPIMDRYAGIAPLKVDLDGVQAGWFRPVSLSGLKLLDGEGHLLARIGQVQTDKGILGWIRNSGDLGTIRLSSIEAAIAAYDGTTNIEQALQPILEQFAAPETADQADDGDAANTTGTIEIVDSKFLLLEKGRPEQWVFALEKMTLVLPAEGELVGPLALQATIADVSGTVQQSVGKISAQVRQAENANGLMLDASLEHVPADVWHVAHARLPDLPINELRGFVSANLAGHIVDENRWTLDLRSISTQNFQIIAPKLVGDNPAKLQQLAAAGSASLHEGILRIQNANLQCDFASANANATLKWPLQIPTALDPFFAGEFIEAQGSVDLPRLAAAAQSLLPVRDNTQLISGSAQFAVSQKPNPEGNPTSRARFTLSGLSAVAAGQPIEWKDPLTVEMAVDRGPSGLQGSATAAAEFCSLTAGGTIEAGKFAGNVDLDLLQQRVSQYIDLPIQTMTGSATVDAKWNMIDANTLQASGTLNTTPLIIAATSGGQIQEPAWNCDFNATTSLESGLPTLVQRAAINLRSRDEHLTVDLREPIRLSSSADEHALPPAAFTLNLVGDLANWKRRGTMWLTEPPEMSVAGNLSLAVEGKIDLEHAEILSANWSSRPLQITTPSLSFAEPQMVGNFNGRVDTNDLTRLVVDKLEIQSTSLSLGARDAANAGGSRVGQAMFLVDLNRLMKSVEGAVGGANPAAPHAAAVAQTGLEGRVQGQLGWLVDPKSASMEIRANGENVRLTSFDPQTGTQTVTWEEPQLSSIITGKWLAETGAVNVESLQMQTPWMNYQGNLAYSSEGEQQIVQMRGNAVYDSVRLTAKLQPFTGSQVELYGQHTMPVDLTWTSSSDPNRSSLAGLSATTRLGWQTARVAGIELGQADVPVQITAGQLASAAELPVSGGKLRWNVTSDLTADEMVIVQSPMTVLENVQITEKMCQDWLKYVTPLLAEATSVDGRLSVRLDQALLVPANTKKQTVAGQLFIHKATVGPGPLSNQVITLVKQVDAIRKKELLTQPVSSQRTWMDMPEQKIDFQMVDGRVAHRNLNVTVGDASIGTSGTVDIEGRLEMLASMPIPDDWIEKSPLLAGLRGQSLQFPVRGTLSQPQVDSNAIRQFSQQAVQSAASGVIQQQLSKGLGKLFGGQVPPQLSPTAPIAPPSGP